VEKISTPRTEHVMHCINSSFGRESKRQLFDSHSSFILALLDNFQNISRRLEYISPGNFVSPAVFVWNRKINIRKSHNNALLYAKAFWLLIELFIDIAMENLSDEASDSENEVDEDVDCIAENNPRSGD